MKAYLISGLYTLFTLFAIAGIGHLFNASNDAYPSINAFFALMIFFITGSGTFIYFIKRILTGKWSNLPTGPELTKSTSRHAIAAFYSAALPGRYPNLHFIGVIYRDLLINMKLTTLDEYENTPKPPANAWISTYYESLSSIMDIVHASVHGTKWLGIVEKTLSDPTYAHTFAYLRNLLDNPEYTKLLHDAPDTDDTLLTPILMDHLHRIVQLTQELRQQFNTIESAYTSDVRANAARLNENDFDTLKSIESPSQTRTIDLAEYINKPIDNPDVKNNLKRSTNYDNSKNTRN